MNSEGSMKKYWLLIFTLGLLIITVFLICLDWQNTHRQFTFAMLEVGQGDGLFIQSPTGTQVLVDGGPPNQILGRLSQVMSPFDRSIDAIIITNPDQDHISGFLDVLKFYKVGEVFESGTWSDSKIYQNLEDEIKSKNIPDILAKRGMRLDLGGGAVLDILFPDRDVSGWQTNDGSVVAKLTYGNTSIMLTGDATKLSERIVLSENTPQQMKSNILKVGHHGSNTSTSPEFLQAVAPTLALISVGQDNKYGHPKQETLNELLQAGVKIFRTDQLGSIILKSDGKIENFKFIK